ncbi:MAG: hypothetical protein Fur0018_14560 [Anaerolineales bacterium]
MPLIVAGIGLLLLIGAFFLVRSKQTPAAAFTYDPADVVSDSPMHAEHEMSGPTLDQIPFLPKDGPQPKIVVSEDFYNFGQIGATDVVTHDFVIKNAGDAPLTISRAYTTCGCTTADFSATVIPPGKVAIVTLRLDAGFHDVRGQTVRRGIIIENNDPAHPQVELWTQASVGR